MEIKAKLEKPYTKEQRLNFIVVQNHQKGYEIKETKIALEAWGLTEDEIEHKNKEKRKAEIIAYMEYLDSKSVRPLRAQAAGTATQEDLDKLADIEAQMEALRAELKELGD